MGSFADATFNQSTGVINVNLRAVPSIANLLKFIIYVLYPENLDGIHMNPLFNYLFGTNQIGSIGCVIHELEHARRNNTHEHDNAHGSGYDAQGGENSFDACAKSYAINMIHNGFIARWVENFRAVVTTEDIKLIADHLVQLQQLEHEDKEEVMALFES